MARFYVDTIDIWKQKLLPLLPMVMPFQKARKLLLSISSPSDVRDEYLATMRLEVLWLSKKYLKENFIHSGIKNIDPNQTYIVTSLHFGQWGMYPASLFQQFGISSQMVMTGRNNQPGSPIAHFWEKFGHSKQILSGYPGTLSTKGFYHLTKQVKSGISQVVIMDVREQGLKQNEVELEFLSGPYYLPRTVALLARKNKVSILPYIGYYDENSGKHLVQWFNPITPSKSDKETLQKILQLFEPLYSSKQEFYFNEIDFHRRPYVV